MQPSVAALLLSVAVLGQPAPIFGVVVDGAGKGVANALVRLEIAGRPAGEGRTSLDGRFDFHTRPAGEVRLVASAPGFAPASVTLADGASRIAEVTLQLTALFEEVQVTPRADLPRPDLDAATMVFGSAPLRTRAGLTIDDALRMVPGFTLGPRISSRVAGPESQGMSLRGLGGSGASRSVLLTDGAPLNDAFAGQVSWDQVPQSAIDRIEVVRGGGDRYGVDAVGGLVEIVTVRPARASARALVEGGGLGTGRMSLFIGDQRRGWSLSGAGEWFRTNGYIMVAEDERGLIETPARSRHHSAFGAVGYQSGHGWRFDVRGNAFSGNRNNGTPAQISATDARQASGEAAGIVAGGFLSLRVSGVSQQRGQRFSVPSAEPPRVNELVDRVDYVQTRVVAVTSQWSRPLGRHSLVAGGQGRAINTTTEEMKPTWSGAFGTSTADARQDFSSAFARATFVVSDRLTVAAGARGDLSHSESEQTFVARNAASFSPRVSFSYRVGATGMVVRGSAYRAYRPPTLQELHHSLRIGNNEIEPNAALEPEKLTAWEGGLMFSRRWASARVTGFWNVLDNAVTNVTVSTSPWMNVRRRQNVDRLRSNGVEFEGTLRLPQSVFVCLTSAITSSTFEGHPWLANNRVPQVPAYNVGLNLRYDDGVWVVSGQLRVTGPQVEDDVNTLRLRRATVVDMLGSRAVTRRLNVFVALENVFDNNYDAARTPTRLVGLPRTVRGGVQVAIP
jgi:outer membrane cobalamin receptor